jgi:Xaa-Pro aminopeptidase
MREAHLRDGAAVVEFLAWLDAQTPKGGLTEIAVVQSLEGFRRATNALHDISFDTICGAGPNGAIMHYRVTDESNRAIGQNELLLVDSGGQYRDGTTDITRTIAVGDPGEEARACYTRVLQGLIAISRARWPRGLAGRDLDPLARQALWMAGQDFNHGTGHGVGAFLSVHEGPQRLSRISEVPLEPGMILSNEPGYYREGAFGIRLENLIVVQVAEAMGDLRDQLSFETLTFAPFDRRLIDTHQLSAGERDWLNAYHAQVLAHLTPRLSAFALAWARQACEAL